MGFCTDSRQQGKKNANNFKIISIWKGVLEQLGAKCGEYFANKYKNDPEGFFAYIKSNWAESVDYDKGKGIVTVNEKVRDTCNCPFISK